MEKDTLKDMIVKANHAYRFGEATISDIEFDHLLEKYRSMVTEEEFEKFRDSLNEKTSNGKIKHKFICGSLDKLKNEEPEAIIKFIEKHCKTRMSISAKLDGISGVATYRGGKLVAFATRGDGYEGEDILAKAKFIKGLKLEIPHKDEITIRGELVIKRDDFDDLCDIQKFSNPRNACAGLINQKDIKSELLSKISYVTYTVLGGKYTKEEQFKILEDLGFEVAWNKIIGNVDLKTINDELYNYAMQQFDMETDGLVISSPDYRNEEKYRPDAQMAYKTNTQVFETRLVDVEFDGPSKNGMYVPVGILEPTDVGGVIVSRCTLHNLDFIREKNLKIGSVVTILRSGDVIPKLVSVVSSDETCVDIEPPTTCKCCGSELVNDGINMRCMNHDCKDQVITRIMFFIKKLGVKNCSFATLDNLGIHSFKDLIDFKPNAKYKVQTKLFNDLKEKVFTKSDRELLAATDFCGLSETLLNKLIDSYGMSLIREAAASSDAPLKTFKTLPPGIGETTLEKFMDDILDNLSVVDMIMKDSRYNCLGSNSGQQELTSAAKNGMSICFTGSLSTMSRNDASKRAVAAGYEIKSGVTRGLTYLVTNDPNSGSSKNKKAKQLGVKVISEKEFVALLSNEATDILAL